MSNAYPEMIKLERDQKHFKTYASLYFSNMFKMGCGEWS